MHFNENELDNVMGVIAALMPIIDYADAELRRASSKRDMYDLTTTVELARQSDELAVAALEALVAALKRAGLDHDQGHPAEHARELEAARQRDDYDAINRLARHHYAAYSGMTSLERCLYDIERLPPLPPAVTSDSGSHQREERRAETAHVVNYFKNLVGICQRELAHSG